MRPDEPVTRREGLVSVQGTGVGIATVDRVLPDEDSFFLGDDSFERCRIQTVSMNVFSMRWKSSRPKKRVTKVNAPA
jgi:hypothetical protein